LSYFTFDQVHKKLLQTLSFCSSLLDDASVAARIKIFILKIQHWTMKANKQDLKGVLQTGIRHHITSRNPTPKACGIL
jgi:hypothetical protein